LQIIGPGAPYLSVWAAISIVVWGARYVKRVDQPVERGATPGGDRGGIRFKLDGRRADRMVVSISFGVEEAP